jgi:hypothetical protein
MNEKEARLQELKEEYEVLKREIAVEKPLDPSVMRDMLYQLLYGAIVRHGVTEEAPGVMVIQIPMATPSFNHRITWSYADDKKSLFVRIIDTGESVGSIESPPATGGITVGKPVDEEAKKAMEEVMA